MKYVLPFLACLPFVLMLLQYFRCSNALTRKIATTKLTMILLGTIAIQVVLFILHRSAALIALICALCVGGFAFVSLQKEQKEDGRAITRAGLRIGEKSGGAAGTALGAAAGAALGSATGVGTPLGAAAGSKLGNAAGKAAGGVFGSIADNMEENDGVSSLKISGKAFEELDGVADSVAKAGAAAVENAAKTKGVPVDLGGNSANIESAKVSQIEDIELIQSRNDFIEACKQLGVDTTDDDIDKAARAIVSSAPNIAKTKLESMSGMNDYDKAVYVLERRYLQ